MIVGVIIFLIFVLVGISKDINQSYTYKKQQKIFYIGSLQVKQQVDALKYSVFYKYVKDTPEKEREKFLKELAIHILHKDKEYWKKNGLQKTLERQQKLQSYDYIDFCNYSLDDEVNPDANYPVKEKLIKYIKDYERKYTPNLASSVNIYLKQYYFEP